MELALRPQPNLNQRGQPYVVMRHKLIGLLLVVLVLVILSATPLGPALAHFVAAVAGLIGAIFRLLGVTVRSLLP